MLRKNSVEQQNQEGEASGLFMRSPEKPSEVKASSEADAEQQLKWAGSHLVWRGFLPVINDSVRSSM